MKTSTLTGSIFDLLDRELSRNRVEAPPEIARGLIGGYVADRVFFADEASAIAAGYRPCAACLPTQYRVWRARETGRA